MTRSSPPSRVLDAQPDDRRAQDVAGVDERGVDAGRDLDLVAVVEGLNCARERSASFAVYSGASRSISRCGGWARSSASGSRGQAVGGSPGSWTASMVVATCSAPRRRRRGGDVGGAAVVVARWHRRTVPDSPAAARSTAAWYSSASRRSSASTSSGCRFSQRASRLANSSWSLPESSRTSVASSTVPAVAWIGPR